MKNIAVIGAGVSGLTTAHCLRRAGHSVRIFTEKLPMETTSAVAAAIWFPYRVGPVEEALQWSKRTFEVFKAMSLDGADAGVSMVDLLLLESAWEPWWLGAVPAGHARRAEPSELVDGFPAGWVVQVPMVETQLYLPWLAEQLQGMDVRIITRKLGHVAEVAGEFDVVVNCAGLGARELVGDSEMHAIRGQILRVDAAAGARYIIADEMPGMTELESTYIFPRQDGIILGGTAVEGDEDMHWDAEMGEGILARCGQLVPALRGVQVRERLVGLRPGRREIRLARHGDVVHNYGHGGAGYTVSWGCAEAVSRLVGHG